MESASTCTVDTNFRGLPATNLQLSKLSELRMFLFPRDFTAQLAYWVVRQSPYTKPEALSDVVGEYHEFVSKIWNSQRVSIEVPIELSFHDVKGLVNEDVFARIPAIRALNRPKAGGDVSMMFVSRYSRAIDPDCDFIDLGALARNVFYGIVRHYLNDQDHAVVTAHCSP